MKEFIEKLIARLGNHIEYCESCHEEFPNAKMSLTYEVQINSYKNIIEIVNELAEEYNNDWISCNERLPENFTECLVTLENGGVFQAKYIIDEFKRICEHGVTDFYQNNKVIAWQPLPAPYKEGE